MAAHLQGGALTCLIADLFEIQPFPVQQRAIDRMAKKKTRALKEPPEKRSEPAPGPAKVEETPFEAVASICSVLVVGLFILTFVGQNYLIPSGSMEKTLLVGDHLVVDRITLSPPTNWMPLVHYREPKRGDIVDS